MERYERMVLELVDTSSSRDESMHIFHEQEVEGRVYTNLLHEIKMCNRDSSRSDIIGEKTTSLYNSSHSRVTRFSKNEAEPQDLEAVICN